MLRRGLTGFDPRVKPAYGRVEVDGGSPEAAGWQGAWLVNEGAGAITDVVSRRLATVTGTVGTWQVGPYGLEFSFAGNGGAYFETNAGRRVAHLPNATILWFGKRAQGGSTEAIYCERAASGNDIWRFGHAGGIAGVAFEHRDDAGTLNDFNASTAVDTYGLHGMTKTGTTVQLYQFGLPVVGGGTITGTDTLTDAIHSIIGNDFQSSTIPFHGILVFLSVWARALSAGEIRERVSAPYLGLRAIIRRRYFVPAAGPPPPPTVTNLPMVTLPPIGSTAMAA